MTTVADLVAKLGFKVDDSGFNKFKNSLQAFQSIVRDGIKDLKEYAKQAEKISKAFQNAYIPSRKDATARYRAVTEELQAKAFAQRVRAEWLPKALEIRDRNAISRKRSLDLKEKGIGPQTINNTPAILQILKGIAGFSFGGVAGGLASLAGFSHPIVMAISLGVKAIVSTLQMVMRVIREGIRSAMSYRDYMAFTGKSTRGISGLMRSSLNTTNLTPEDIMRDTAGFEKQYWDMMFGGGNPRFWQMIGRLPTGEGEKDLKTILQSVYTLSDNLKERGLARSLLAQAGLSEDYITLIEDIIKNNPTMSADEFFTRTRDQISSLEENNKNLRELDRQWKELKIELAKVLLDSNLIELMRDLVEGLRSVVDAINRWIGWKNGDTDGARLYKKATRTAEYLTPIVGQVKMLKDMWSGENIYEGSALKDLVFGGSTDSHNTYNINNNQTNQVSVDSTGDAADYVNKVGADLASDMFWHRENSAYRMAPATGG